MKMVKEEQGREIERNIVKVGRTKHIRRWTENL